MTFQHKLVENLVNHDMIAYLKGIPPNDLHKVGIDAGMLKSYVYRLSGIRKDGRLLTTYNKGRCGRYVAKKGLSIMKGAIRRLMTPDGYGEIDLKACHLKIIQDEARKCGIELNELNNLINNREDILRDLGGSRGDAKVRVLRVLYGGKVAENDHPTLKALEGDILTPFQ